MVHSILIIIYHLLQKECTYHELGTSSFEERERDVVKRRSIRSLERLGYQVSLQEVNDGAWKSELSGKKGTFSGEWSPYKELAAGEMVVEC